ncbi:Shedu anti-phage system protein SduA domain-containing protein [Carboxylicivirga marina]|uniref:DUF4263 domain-containing protein n=1 Tax=Carboxylicivirga marina TaxID=2800988 RepID=A0ABS1HQD3_9BACT|nr:Shedu anti-phage system protein SduA domain-containing protein [Carboxylicivirga marina]MBK3519902.1 DUF4263 domain-containing protein [Carboxylicivirga marina]
MKLPTAPKPIPKNKEEIKHPADYPPKEYFTHKIFLKDKAVFRLTELIQSNAGERELDKCLTDNPELFDSILDNTGNHGIWVLSKQQIKSRVSNKRGLIPDFIVGGKNSDGFQWWVVEIKGANQKLFRKSSQDEYYLTSESNKGISQLVEYIDYCRKQQAYFRDELKLKDFREVNGILILGKEEEFEDNEIRQELKSAWNKTLMPNIQIRTFSSMLRKLK